MASRKQRYLVDQLVKEGHLKTNKIIKTFLSVPRENFVPREYRHHAYIDEPLPIGFGQTISAPHMVAIMTELLKPDKKDKVLEIGSGSGYQAAILSKLVKKVFTIELDRNLAEFSRENLKKTRIRNVKIIQGDGSRGYSKEAPYDKIIVTCAGKEIPKPLIAQLKNRGIIVAPVGGEWYQDLILGIKKGKKLETKNYGGCVFVLLRH